MSPEEIRRLNDSLIEKISEADSPAARAMAAASAKFVRYKLLPDPRSIAVKLMLGIITPEEAQQALKQAEAEREKLDAFYGKTPHEP